MITMTVFLIILTLLILMLILKISVEIYAELENFKTEYKIKIKFLGFFTVNLPKLKKQQKQQTEGKKKKPEFNEIKKEADKLLQLVRRIVKILRGSLNITKLDTKIVPALGDPMINGMLTGILSAVVAEIYAVIAAGFKTKNPTFAVTPDFESEKGITAQVSAKLTLRPIAVLKCLIFNK